MASCAAAAAVVAALILAAALVAAATVAAEGVAFSGAGPSLSLLRLLGCYSLLDRDCWLNVLFFSPLSDSHATLTFVVSFCSGQCHSIQQLY